jgi:hypothetical protein
LVELLLFVRDYIFQTQIHLGGTTPIIRLPDVGNLKETHFSSETKSGILAGAINTDARHSTFVNIAGNLHNTYVNAVSDSAEILATLKPVERGACYVPPCLDGTREKIFDEIDQWLSDVDAPNVVWLAGGPGAGKSTIASSLVSKLTVQRRLGASFFFRRGNAMLSDPTALWRTVAYDLALFEPIFSINLVKTLKERRIDPGWPDIAFHFKILVQELLTKTYDHTPAHTLPVILIDAFDECDSDHSPAQQKALLDTLTQWSYLPKKFKLIVTGRDDRVPQSFRVVCKQIMLHTGDNVDDDANKDIRHFFQEHFAELGGSSFPQWPGKYVLDALTQRAAGLFIWAETVVRFLEQGLPNEQLSLVLKSDLGGEDNITKLYRQVLKSSFRNVNTRMLEVTRVVISTIVLARVPLYYADVHKFVSQPHQSIEFILKKLATVILIGNTDERVYFGHLSFSEFLCDPKRCPGQFFIDREKDSRQLAEACLRLMKDGLKFNICDLETSHVLNKNLPERISKQIETAIPPPLSYSCRFWAVHLQDTTIYEDGSDPLIEEVEDFLHVRLLYWLEIMSLIEEVSGANTALLTVVSCVQVRLYSLVSFQI